MTLGGVKQQSQVGCACPSVLARIKGHILECTFWEVNFHILRGEAGWLRTDPHRELDQTYTFASVHIRQTNASSPSHYALNGRASNANAHKSRHSRVRRQVSAKTASLSFPSTLPATQMPGGMTHPSMPLHPRRAGRPDAEPTAPTSRTTTLGKNRGSCMGCLTRKNKKGPRGGCFWSYGNLLIGQEDSSRESCVAKEAWRPREAGPGRETPSPK